jgi:hypothetical protein
MGALHHPRALPPVVACVLLAACQLDCGSLQQGKCCKADTPNPSVRNSKEDNAEDTVLLCSKP